MSRLAAGFAAVLGYEEEARLAGLLHDCGKYGDLFQLRLQGKARNVDHWSAGAYLAFQAKAGAASLAIYGHHVGLPSVSHNFFVNLQARVQGQIESADGQRLAGSLRETVARLEAEALHWVPLNPQQSVFSASQHAIDQMLDIRFLYSCLVDADFLDTEAHFHQKSNREKRFRHQTPDLNPAQSLALLEHYVAELAKGDDASAGMAQLRQAVFKSAVDAGRIEGHLWTLTAPTGSGKTMAMLAFALHHARKFGKRRIVVALPYLNIIEQTADEYRRALNGMPADYILEQHSLAERDADDDEGPGRLAVDNWDAPIVVTTTVQLFESLFSNRPGRARKLHRLADSVVILDEIQTLPLPVVLPTVAMLAALGDRYRTTVVLGTATQPAFDLLQDHIQPMTQARYQPQEIALSIAAPTPKVEYSFREQSQSWSEVALELQDHPTFLAIVNLKRHARNLSEALGLYDDESFFHLSTNLCAIHRSTVLNTIRDRLSHGLPVRVVATQCVEAGVNLDFPVVYRAWGPLDSLVQAAGRCNRSGKMPTNGQVVIFQPEDDAYPPGPYQQFTQIAKALWKRKRSLNVDDPNTFRSYWQMVYGTVGPETAYDELVDAIKSLNFPRVNDLYRLIEEKTAQVLMPYQEALGDFESLVLEARQRGISRDWIRRAQPLSVGVYLPRTNAAMTSHLEPVRSGTNSEQRETGWWICRDAKHYDRVFGLDLPGTLGLLYT